MGNRYTCKYTFEEWCINNDRLDILDRWDYEKNDKLPSQVAYRTKMKYYFKSQNPNVSNLVSIIGLTTTNDEGIYRNLNSRRENLVGQKFGSLTVLYLDEKKTNETDDYHSYWICRCDCGNILSVKANHLKTGHTVSCGDRNKHWSGENSHSWKGGVTEENERIRSSSLYKQFRQAVLEKDNHKCIICGSTEDLQVHHIYPFSIYPDDRMRVETGVTVCAKHHTIGDNSFHGIFGTHNNTPEQFEYYVNMKRQELGIKEPFDVYKYMNPYDADDMEIDDSMLDLEYNIDN